MKNFHNLGTRVNCCQRIVNVSQTFVFQDTYYQVSLCFFAKKNERAVHNSHICQQKFETCNVLLTNDFKQPENLFSSLNGALS